MRNHSLSLSFLRHLNIGAGRIVWQDIVRIDVSIKKREFHKNDVILESFKHAKDTTGRLHLIGLVRPIWARAWLRATMC